MVKSRRIVAAKENEEEVHKAMFIEYREENAKDMAREANGRW
jgi:hypothetical protein